MHHLDKRSKSRAKTRRDKDPDYAVTSPERMQAQRDAFEDDKYFKKPKPGERPGFLQKTYERVLKIQGTKTLASKSRSQSASSSISDSDESGSGSASRRSSRDSRSGSRNSTPEQPVFKTAFRVNDPIDGDHYSLDRKKRAPTLRTVGTGANKHKKWKFQKLELDHHPTQFAAIKEAYGNEVVNQRMKSSRIDSPTLAAAFRGANSDPVNLRAISHEQHKLHGKRSTLSNMTKSELNEGKSLFEKHLNRFARAQAGQPMTTRSKETLKALEKVRNDLDKPGRKRPEWMYK